MSKVEYDERMLEETYLNRFLNMIATEYNGGLARDFEKYWIAKDKEIERLNNIIKEVKEWILFWKEESLTISTDILDELLEILNKGE